MAQALVAADELEQAGPRCRQHLRPSKQAAALAEVVAAQVPAGDVHQAAQVGNNADSPPGRSTTASGASRRRLLPLPPVN